MKLHEKVILALWSEFTDYLSQQIPVYFTFTNDLVEELLDKNGIKFSTGTELINSLVSELIFSDNLHVYLKHDALERGKSGNTAAILFVCQQILAVEEMSSTDMYSENAYFPHLRRYLSPHLEQISQNPFIYSEFEKIWRTLAREIYRLSRSGRCVTFTIKDHCGANKAKGIPLSQALFNKEDVIRLIDSLGYSNLQTNSKDLVFKRITDNKRVLSGRGKRLVKQVWMKDSLVKQVVSLSRSIGEIDRIRNVLSKKTKKLEELRLKIYIDSIDWLNTEYVVNLFDQTNNLIQDLAIINEYYELKVHNRDFSIFSPSEDGDCWLQSPEIYSPTRGDELIVVCNQEQDSAIKGLFAQYFNLGNTDLIDTKIKRYKRLKAFRFRTGEEFDKRIYIKSGKLYINEEQKGKDRVSFKGGLLVNLKQDRFACDFLPSEVLINGIEYKLTNIVKINGSLHSFDNFRKEVLGIVVDTNFTIEFNDSAKFNLKVAPIASRFKADVEWMRLKNQILPIHRSSRFTEEEGELQLPTHLVFKKLKKLSLKNNSQKIHEILIQRQVKKREQLF